MIDSDRKIIETLRAKAEAAGWPILIIDEYSSHEVEFLSFSEVHEIDLVKLLTEENVYKLRYVNTIIDCALSGSSETTTSLKFSFTDTSDWWYDFEPINFDNRKKIEIRVEVYH